MRCATVRTPTLVPCCWACCPVDPPHRPACRTITNRSRSAGLSGPHWVCVHTESAVLLDALSETVATPYCEVAQYWNTTTVSAAITARETTHRTNRGTGGRTDETFLRSGSARVGT